MTNQQLLEMCKVFGQQLRENWPRARDERGAELTHDSIFLKEVSQDEFQGLLRGIDDLIQKSEVRIDHDICFVDCSFLVFKEKLSLPNLDYGITFKQSEFKAEVDLKGREINGPVNFAQAKFHKKTDFSNSHFHKTLNLNYAVFGPTDRTENNNILVADFTRTEFEKDIILENSIFMGDAHFRHTKFLGDTKFRQIGFPPPAIADFSNACFEKPFTFYPKNIGPNLGQETEYIFEKAEFENSAEIAGNLYNVEFSSAKFFETALFKCSFLGITNFKGASFGKLADFSAVRKAEGKIEFKEVCFNGKTEFFSEPQPVVMDLTKAKFSQAPHFCERGLHPDTKIRTAKFTGFATEDDYQNYRILKRECARIHAREEENIFHYCEMRTLAKLYLSHPKSFLLGILSYLYFLISRYGQGPFQALLVLAGLMALFGCYYTNNAENIVFHKGDSIEWAKCINTGILYTFQNIVYPFSQFTQKGIIEAKTGSLAILGVFQSLTFFTVFGLFILAIRRRFRKGSE